MPRAIAFAGLIVLAAACTKRDSEAASDSAAVSAIADSVSAAQAESAAVVQPASPLSATPPASASGTAAKPAGSIPARKPAAQTAPRTSGGEHDSAHGPKYTIDENGTVRPIKKNQ